ncbi:carbohydrate kinase family protein [Gelidibacter gilvus]|uniref:Carbohydrate kinase n=1 Tax=Gelidibacter gilvus TaxID=59602 RepID=A0A4Q0XCU3_9FLAO|nr:carbohydrate kinase [Gelidibacter gilvus]RXJ45752.1 carbohydrate kinase [Gelidibacter gilvus]
MFNNKEIIFVSYGEVLFDVFKNKKQIGGAPLNLALRISSFGFPVSMISGVGDDEDGKAILNYIAKKGLNTDGIFNSDRYKTGLVNVHINERGSASYNIEYPSAWDKIETNNIINHMIEEADVFLYGSLVCRDNVSKNTLLEILRNQHLYKVFDVNLRKPHYTMEILKSLMHHADFIKFNDEELKEISENLGSTSKSIEENMIFISKLTNTKSLCVTKGKHGSVLLWKEIFYYNSGFSIEVIDTVGAGDSFLAALISKLLSNDNPQEAIDFGSAIGSMVASCEGANPEFSVKDIESFLSAHRC